MPPVQIDRSRARSDRDAIAAAGLCWIRAAPVDPQEHAARRETCRPQARRIVPDVRSPPERASSECSAHSA